MAPQKEPRPAATRRIRTIWFTVFFIAGLIGLWWPFYNRIEPKLFGFPFFYWFQFLWVGSGALITGLAYRARA